MNASEVNSIIRENKARRKALFAPYDPVTGVGSPIERERIEFSVGGNEFVWGIPVTMYNENAALIDAIARDHKLESVLHAHGIPADNTGIELFLRDLINQRFRYDYEFWSVTAARIQDKRTKQIVPFTLNQPQRKVLAVLERMRIAGIPIRIIIDKARQWGGSTLVQIYMAWIQLIHRTRWHSCIVTDVEEQARNIRAMYSRLISYYPKDLGGFELSPLEGSNKNRRIDERDCSIIIGSSQKPDSLRTFDLAMAHLSEVSFWKTTELRSAEDLAQSVRAGVAQVPFSLIALESTAKGVGNFFHREWLTAKDGRSAYAPVFVAWFEIEMYQKDIKEADLSAFIKWMGGEPYASYLWSLGATLEGIKWYFDFRNGENYDEWRMKSEYPSTCIAQGAKIGTDLGIIPIEECAHASITRTGEITNFLNNGLRDVFRLTTKYGYEVECTHDHRIKVIGETGHEEWRVLENLKTGDSIILSVPRFAEEIYVHKWKENFVEHSITITPELGRFLGIFMGDGSYCDHVLSIACDARDTDFIDSTIELAYNLFGIKLNKRLLGKNKGCCEIRAKKQSLTPYFRELGIIDHEWKETGTKRKVCVPEIIWRSPEPVVKEFLRGIFETDGFNGYEVPKIGLFSKHLNFLKDIQLLLLGFGITSIIRQRPAKTNQYHYIANTLTLQGEQADYYRNKIGFLSERKQERFTTWEVKSYIKRTKVILSDVVSSIDFVGPKQVYDITIRKSHEFSANGILVHNCEESFQATGARVFSPAYVNQARKHKMEPDFVGDVRGKTIRDKTALEDIEFIEANRGNLFIWMYPDKEEQVSNRYVVSMDIGGRSPGADYTVMRVFDRYGIMDGGVPETVATWRGHIDQDLGAWKAVQLAKMYNNALFIPESNSYDKTSIEAEGDHFLTILDEIVKYYPNIFARTDPEKIRQGIPVKYGFHTNPVSKPMIIDFLNAALRDELFYERDDRVFSELDTYEIKPNGRYGAVDGCHDDMVMATAIGLWACLKHLPPPKIILPTVKRRPGRITEATI